MHRLALAISIGFVTVVALGCASSKKSTETSKSGTERAKDSAERTPSAPKPENLAESPCGNPNWAQMPEEHAVDGDPDSEDDAEATSSDDSEDEPSESKPPEE